MNTTKILELLKNTNLSNRQLEMQIGLSNGCIGKWESGKIIPNVATINKIANYFGVSVDYLLGREEKQTKLQEVGQNTTADATMLPILQIWAELDEVQRASMLRYGETLIAKDNRPKGVISEQ